MSKHKCPINLIAADNEKANLSQKQIIKKIRKHCINDCNVGCNNLDILKRIYWELFKMNELKRGE